jgi:hypothetical protein
MGILQSVFGQANRRLQSRRLHPLDHLSGFFREFQQQDQERSGVSGLVVRAAERKPGVPASSALIRRLDCRMCWRIWGSFLSRTDPTAPVTSLFRPPPPQTIASGLLIPQAGSPHLSPETSAIAG